MNLLYDAPTAGSGSAQYNGNISEMQWRTNTASCLTLQAYRFSYDKGNRLLAADHWTNPSGTWINTGNYSESGIAYDLNGNLKGFIRNGLTTTANVFGTIDRLTYSYDPAKPDRLINVQDISSKDKGFKFPAAGMPASPHYVYDDNGNMINDKNKNLFITYNHLILPKTFTVNGNLITMTYTADGEKLTKVGATTKNYISGIEYTGANLEAIYTSDGRCTPNGTSFFYEYSIKDHLGNTRVSLAFVGVRQSHLESL